MVLVYKTNSSTLFLFASCLPFPLKAVISYIIYTFTLAMEEGYHVTLRNCSCDQLQRAVYLEAGKWTIDGVLVGKVSIVFDINILFYY